MTHYNFAVVFAPNLIKFQSGDLGLTGLAIAKFNSILSLCRELFPKPVDQCLVDFKKSLTETLEEVNL